MDHVQEARQLHSDDLELDPPVVDSDEHEPVVEIVGGCRYDHGVAGILEGCQGVCFANAMPSGRLSEPNLLHAPLCATQLASSILWRTNPAGQSAKSSCQRRP